MAKYVRETDDVLLPLVVGDCEEVAEVVGEDLLPRDAGSLRQLFHPAQDAAAVDGSAAAGDEDAPVRDALFPAVLSKLSAEGTVDKDGAGLAFEGDGGAVAAREATVMKGSSLTRIPVPARVSMMRAS